MAVAFASGPTYADATGTFYATGKYVFETPELSPPMSQIIFGGAPGVNGSYSIDFGFRSQDFALRVLYVNTSADAVVGAFNSDMTAIVGPNDVTANGVTLKRCFVDAGATHCTPVEKIVAGDGAGTVLFMMYAIIKCSSKGAAS